MASTPLHPVSLASGLLTELLGQLVGNAVHAAHGRDNPNLVSHAHVAVFAAVTFEGAVFMGDAKFHVDRVVRVFQQSGQVGLDLLLVNPMSLFYGHQRVSDGVTVFDYLVAFGKIFQRDFVSGGDVFGHGDGHAVHGDGFAGLEFRYGYGHIVGRVDF